MSFDHDSESGPQQLDRIDTHEKASDGGKGFASVRIDYDLCEATGVCAVVCPEDVLEHSGGVSKVIDARACTECWLCVESCVSGAIEIN